MSQSNGSQPTTEEGGVNPSARRRLSFTSPQRRLLGSPYAYSLSPTWVRHEPLPASTSPETTYTTSPSPSTLRSPWSTANRPLNPLNNPLNHPVSRFSIDTTTVLSAPSPAQPNNSRLGYGPVPFDQGGIGTRATAPCPSGEPDTRRWSKYVPLLLLDTFIAVIVVCLASMLSLLIGHLILRVVASQSSPDNTARRPYDAPIIPTIQAGVIGGAVLSLPFAILVKILFPPKDPTPPPPFISEYDDFVSFDDSDAQHGRISTVTYNQGGVRETPLTRYQLHKIFALVFCECVGVSGGPIGVLLLRTCYAGKAGWSDKAPVQLLDPKHAAEAGAVGGVIVGPGVLILIWVVWKIWWDCLAKEAEISPRTHY